ncbi:AraC family transcriptional regulator [Membranihabitans marinus]|uniref:AraC family transcriptional regulator n=1 Tax=Membranihabitans marinus TaxID=1227546 RepID=UPI001F3C7151|nr:helix-turn-helix domain-containing protein [Membranihabitans marinus]
MNTIPNISFQTTDNIKEFEFINLSTLFTKFRTELDHNPNLPHRLSFFALIIVNKGKGSHQIDLVDYSIEKGSVLKIAKGQVHAFEKNPKYEGYMIIFTEAFILNYFTPSSIQQISHLYNYHLSTPIENGEKLNDDFIEQLIQEFKIKNTFGQKNIIAAILALYLLKLERNSENNQLNDENSKYYNLFIQFKNLVELHYSNTRTVKDYANMMFISTKHLNQVVKEYTLNTAKAFIDNYVIMETKRAIVSTDKSLKEIAYEIGFEEVTNFTKFFKNITGISPKEFRMR